MRQKIDGSLQEELETVGACKQRVDHLMEGFHGKIFIEISTSIGECICNFANQ